MNVTLKFLHTAQANRREDILQHFGNIEKMAQISAALRFTARKSVFRTSMTLFHCVVPAWWLP